LIRVFVVDCLHLAFIKMYLFIRVLLVFKSARIVVSFITKCAGFVLFSDSFSRGSENFSGTPAHQGIPSPDW